jgi:hypothetical protein
LGLRDDVVVVSGLVNLVVFLGEVVVPVGVEVTVGLAVTIAAKS